MACFIISIPPNIQARFRAPPLCLKWQQGVEVLFAFPIAIVFVWLHAYCVVMDHSDPGTEGGLLTNRTHCENTGSQRVLSYLDDVYSTLGL